MTLRKMKDTVIDLVGEKERQYSSYMWAIILTKNVSYDPT